MNNNKKIHVVHKIRTELRILEDLFFDDAEESRIQEKIRTIRKLLGGIK